MNKIMNEKQPLRELDKLNERKKDKNGSEVGGKGKATENTKD